MDSAQRCWVVSAVSGLILQLACSLGGGLQTHTAGLVFSAFSSVLFFTAELRRSERHYSRALMEGGCSVYGGLNYDIGPYEEHMTMY